jgi:hypothetical protein
VGLRTGYDHCSGRHLRGADDANSSEHADYLLAHVATAHGHVYSGGHLPGADVYREISGWLRTGAGNS